MAENNDESLPPLLSDDLKIIEAKRDRQAKISKLMGNYLLQGHKMLATTCPKCMTILLRGRHTEVSDNMIDYCVACNEIDPHVSSDHLDCSIEAVVSNSSKECSEEVIHNKQFQQNSSDDEANSQHHISCSSNAGVESSLRMGRPDTGSTQIENRPSLGTLRKIEPPVVSSDQSGLKSRCSIGPANIHPVPFVHHRHRVSSTGIHETEVPHAENPVVTMELPNSAQDLKIAAQTSEGLTVVLDKMEWACESLRKTGDVELCRQLCCLIKDCADAVLPLRQLIRLENNADGTSKDYGASVSGETNSDVTIVKRQKRENEHEDETDNHNDTDKKCLEIEAGGDSIIEKKD